MPIPRLLVRIWRIAVSHAYDVLLGIILGFIAVATIHSRYVQNLWIIFLAVVFAAFVINVVALGFAWKRQLEGHLSAEQLAVVVRLREVIRAVEAQPHHGWTWGKFYSYLIWKPFVSGFTWKPAATRSLKPSLAEIEAILTESVEAVGLADPNVHDALNRLFFAAIYQEDTALTKVVMERNIQCVEHKLGPENGTLTALLFRLGCLQFVEKQYAKCTKSLARALHSHELHRRRKTTGRGLLHHTYFMLARKTLALTYALVEQYDEAEAALKDVLPVVEEEEGILSDAPLSTQAIRGALLHVYLRKGYRASVDVQDPKSAVIATGYLRDALLLSAIHPSFLSNNLRAVGHLFILTGRIADGITVFRLANHIAMASETSASPQRYCMCPPGSEIDHEYKRCDGCNRSITRKDSFYFCRTCENVDLCAECISGTGKSEESGWEEVRRLPPTCLSHDFYEFRVNEIEERMSMTEWVTEVSQRLTADIERASG